MDADFWCGRFEHIRSRPHTTAELHERIRRIEAALGLDGPEPEPEPEDAGYELYDED